MNVYYLSSTILRCFQGFINYIFQFIKCRYCEIFHKAQSFIKNHNNDHIRTLIYNTLLCQIVGSSKFAVLGKNHLKHFINKNSSLKIPTYFYEIIYLIPISLSLPTTIKHKKQGNDMAIYVGLRVNPNKTSLSQRNIKLVISLFSYQSFFRKRNQGKKMILCPIKTYFQHSYYLTFCITNTPSHKINALH